MYWSLHAQEGNIHSGTFWLKQCCGIGLTEETEHLTSPPSSAVRAALMCPGRFSTRGKQLSDCRQANIYWYDFVLFVLEALCVYISPVQSCIFSLICRGGEKIFSLKYRNPFTVFNHVFFNCLKVKYFCHINLDNLRMSC